MALTRQHLSQIYRPLGPKQIQTGIAWTSGGSFQSAAGAVDLSLPIHAIRMVFKGRLVIGTAAFTSTNPEGFLNLISNIQVFGVNKRIGGNATLYNIDLATLFTLQHMIAPRIAQFDINGSEIAVPSLPFPATYINGATGTYDFRVVIDLPFHHFGAGGGVRPGWLVRQDEWKDTVLISMIFGAQAGGGATGVLGVSAATTTVTFSAFGSGTGNPTIDLYSVPVQMGLDLKDTVLPGLLTRIQQPINTVLQTAGNAVNLLNLQKQRTGRVLVKTGTSTVTPAFATLSDTNLTTLGLQLGGNRNVRNRQDIFAHKQEAVEAYQRDPVQGYTMLDFWQSGNPDSAYPGHLIGDGSTFSLIGDVTGVANGFGIIVQEQALYMPQGPLYGG